LGRAHGKFLESGVFGKFAAKGAGAVYFPKSPFFVGYSEWLSARCEGYSLVLGALNGIDHQRWIREFLFR
jgi:hypothetical protein